MYSVGKILKPQGIKGEVKASVLTSFPGHFEELNTVFIGNKTLQAYSIEHVRVSNRFVFIKFKGVDSRNDAELLRNKYLYIREEELTELDEDEYYIHDLIGLKVFSEEDKYLGEIVDVESYSANDVYILRDALSTEYMIPAVKDIILRVDMHGKKMVIRVIDGLLD